MKSLQLLEHLEFHEKNPYAEPLHVDKVGRVLRFTLKPGQQVIEHPEEMTRSNRLGRIPCSSLNLAKTTRSGP